MPESSGMLQSFTIANTLSLVPAPLLLSALIGGVAARARRSQNGRAASLAVLCAAAAALAFALALFHVVELLRTDPGSYLTCHLAQVARIGSFDASIGLTLDRLAAPLLLAVSAIGALVLLAVAITTRRDPLSASMLASSSLLVAALQTLLLANGFFLLLLSWSALLLSSVALLGPRALSAAAAIAQVLLVAAAALLFWSYGGSWRDAGYTPELRPRVIALELPAAPASSGRGGLLSLRVLPGTRIGLGGAELCARDASGRPGGIGLSARPCRAPARSPFSRLPMPAAIHDLHLFAGHETNELSIEKVRITDQRETLLTLLGPTLDFRELFDQLAVSEPAREKSVRRTLPKAEIFGLPALPIAILLVVFAAAIAVVRLPRAWASALPQSSAAVAALSCGLAAVTGVYLLARLDFLAALTPSVKAFGSLLGCTIAVRSAARASAERDPLRATLLVAVAHAGIAFGGVGGGAAEAGVLYLAVASSAACACALAPAGSAQARAHSVAAFALAFAPLPALELMLQRISSDDGARALFPVLVAVLLVAGSGITSYAVWCCHYRGSGGAAKSERERGDFSVHAALTLAVLSLAGAVIGSYWQGFDRSRIALLASLVAPFYGWIAARRRYAASGSEDRAESPLLKWLARAPEERVARWAGKWIDAIGAQLVRIERVLDRPLGKSMKPAKRPGGEG